MRVMRKALASVLLLLSMLLCQLGAMQHEISHLRVDVSGRDHPVHTHTPGTCDTCLAFAPLAGASTPSVPATPLLALAHRWVEVALTATLCRSAPSPRSRGPPATL